MEAAPVCAKCSKRTSKKPPGTSGNGWGCDSAEHRGPNSFMKDDCLWGCSTVLACNWCLCGVCWSRDRAKNAAADKARAHTEGGAPPFCGNCREGLSKKPPGTSGNGWG
ncbi:hypothetical protein B484DRAFT_410193, partial [Ochromonadaceae sp. CCMP2298]